MSYSAREYADMHFLYGYSDGNAHAAAREYRVRYPNRQRFPDHRVFLYVHRCYEEGKIPGHTERPGRPRDDINDEMLLNMVEDDPTTSVRRLSRQTGISRASVHRCLKRNQLYPYHVQRVQALLPTDHAKRVRFCREMLRRNRADPGFFNKILWTDETCFKRTGIYNIHNTHHWSYENPKIVRDSHFQHQFGINIWAGIVDGKMVGPFNLPRRLDGISYLNFLRNNLGEILENETLETRQNLWFQYDGAPAHYYLQVRQHLNAEFSDRLIGRQGTILWPPRSPDLTPLDFFLWGYYKELVFSTDCPSEDELRQRITLATNIISNNEQSFRSLKRNFIRRCRICIREEGRHFEHLL